MGGDEITAEWLGNLYGNRIQTSNIPQRFFATSKRFRTLILANNSTSSYVRVGKYTSSTSVFTNYSIVMFPSTMMKLEYVDLYELGCIESTPGAYIQIFGINEY